LADDPRERLNALYMQGVIEYVSLVAADTNACPTCASLTDRGYQPLKLPRLPLDGCTRPGGCRCRYEPNFVVVE
jgi:hypothetical protein